MLSKKLFATVTLSKGLTFVIIKYDEKYINYIMMCKIYHLINKKLV